MRYPSLLFVLLCLPTFITAQTMLVSRLADQVCRCMETIDHDGLPREQARECVRLVGLRNKVELLDKLNLNPEHPEQLRVLSERMADLLTDNCPVLSTLRLDDYERELRWSDRGTARKAVAKGFRYKSDKSPPPDAPAWSVSEPPAMWSITGVVYGRPGRAGLRLRLADGSLQNLELPAAVRRRAEVVEGQRVTVVFSRQWRKSRNGGIVALVVQSVE